GESRGGVWFSISAGHKQNAEPRWLLPLICRVGHVTRRDVGAIKIFHTESQFEISAEAAERFAAQIAREGTGEKQITITRLPGGPTEQAAEARPREDAKPYKKTPYKPGQYKGGEGKFGGGKFAGGKFTGDKAGEGQEGGGKPFKPKFAGKPKFKKRDHKA
uniref:DbpA RNA binding domain-containing protein n=1 Tax=Ferrovibrio sp. TaxID=1917215 RepID=UPI0035AF89D3